MIRQTQTVISSWRHKYSDDMWCDFKVVTTNTTDEKGKFAKFPTIYIKMQDPKELKKRPFPFYKVEGKYTYLSAWLKENDYVQFPIVKKIYITDQISDETGEVLNHREVIIIS